MTTRLERRRVAASYRHRLDRGFRFFLLFLASYASSASHPPEDLWADAGAVDGLLAQCVNHLHDRQFKIHVARFCILGGQWHHPQLKNRLLRSWNCIKTWQRELPVNNRVPLPREALLALTVKAWSLAMAYPEEAAYLVCLAVLSSVGFWALL